MLGTSGRLFWTQYWTCWFHKMGEISWEAEELLASQEGLCHGVMSWSFIAAEFKIPLGWWPCQVVQIQLRFRAGTGPWNVSLLNHLTWLLAWEDFPCTSLKCLKDSILDLCPIGLACLTNEHRYKHALWDRFSHKITGLHKNSGYWFLVLCTFFLR